MASARPPAPARPSPCVCAGTWHARAHGTQRTHPACGACGVACMWLSVRTRVRTHARTHTLCAQELHPSSDLNIVLDTVAEHPEILWRLDYYPSATILDDLPVELQNWMVVADLVRAACAVWQRKRGFAQCRRAVGEGGRGRGRMPVPGMPSMACGLAHHDVRWPKSVSLPPFSPCDLPPAVRVERNLLLCASRRPL